MKARYSWLGAGGLAAAWLLFGFVGGSGLLASTANASPTPRVECKQIVQFQCLDCPTVTSRTCTSSCAGIFGSCVPYAVMCDPENPDKVCDEVNASTHRQCPNC